MTHKLKRINGKQAMLCKPNKLYDTKENPIFHLLGYFLAILLIGPAITAVGVEVVVEVVIAVVVAFVFGVWVWNKYV